jgi:hypothetical protein
MNPRRQAAILAAQKVRVKTDPVPTPEALKLTSEQRRAMYAPKPATSAPQHLQAPQWVNAWRATTKITYGLTAFTALIFGGIIAGESRKGIKP